MDFKRPRLASKTIGGEDKYTRQDYSEKHGYNDDNARSHYQPKLMSKIAVVISSESGKASNGSGEHNEGVNDRWSPTNVIVIEKPTIQEAYTKPDTISRNKRMFGNLMGHLGKARKILDSDSNMIGKQDQQKIAATIKNQAESKRVFHLHVTEKREEKQRVYAFRKQLYFVIFFRRNCCGQKILRNSKRMKFLIRPFRGEGRSGSRRSTS
jgi:hypothetical protein